MRDRRFDIDSIKCFVTTEKSYMKKALKKADESNASKLAQYSEAAKNNVTKYKDFIVGSEKETLYVYSKLRGVTIVFVDILFKLSESKQSANDDWHKMFHYILWADWQYNIENSDSVDAFKYLDLLEAVYNKEVEEQNARDLIVSKQEAKRQAKASVRFRYKIGEKYALRRKTLKGDEITEEVYEVKKVIYSIGPNIVNTVIMKQIHGKPCQRKTLSPFDCQTFHIKYEPGLFVFSMTTRFYKLSDDYVVQLESESPEKEIDKLVEICIEGDKSINEMDCITTYWNRFSDADPLSIHQFDESIGYNNACKAYNEGILSKAEFDAIKVQRDIQLDAILHDEQPTRYNFIRLYY